MPARTGRHVVSVGRIQPVTIRIESFRLTSSFPAWALRDHTGDAYSLDRVSVAVIYANEQRLKSRRPFSRHAAHLVANNYDPPKAWNDRIDAGPPFIRSACPPPSPSLPPGADLPRKQWVRLNRLRSGTARVDETLQRCGMQEAASCPCGHPTQTVEHVVTDCVLHKSPGDLTAIRCPNAETRSWLSELPIEL